MHKQTLYIEYQYYDSKLSSYTKVKLRQVEQEADDAVNGSLVIIYYVFHDL